MPTVAHLVVLTPVIADSPSGCSVADWKCVRATAYIYPSTPITPTQAASYVARGFEVALHVTTDCSDWTPGSLEDLLRESTR